MPKYTGTADFLIHEGKRYPRGANVPIKQEEADRIAARNANVTWGDDEPEPAPPPAPGSAGIALDTPPAEESARAKR